MSTINFKGFREIKDDYFLLSGVRESKKLKHSPFLVFNGDTVEICDNLEDLIKNYPPETKVIAQWKGQYSSDYFQFEVYDADLYIRSNEKKDYHVI